MDPTTHVAEPAYAWSRKSPNGGRRRRDPAATARRRNISGCRSYRRSLGSARSVARAARKGGASSGPLVGARVSNRFALALISLALDQLDAAQVGRQRVETSDRRRLRDYPDIDGRLVALDLPRLAIPIAATRSPAASALRDALVAVALAPLAGFGGWKRSRGSGPSAADIPARNPMPACSKRASTRSCLGAKPGRPGCRGGRRPRDTRDWRISGFLLRWASPPCVRRCTGFAAMPSAG